MWGSIGRALTCFLATAVLLSAPGPARADGPYTLTIYVERGKTGVTGLFANGHVYIGLYDGVNLERWGWYSAGETTFSKLPALIGCAGGKLKVDDDTPYDVSKTYFILKKDYDAVKARIVLRKAQGDAGTADWSPFKHCGDFAEDMALVAGLPMDLSVGVTGMNRPNLFADYLLAHGGVERFNWEGDKWYEDKGRVRFTIQKMDNNKGNTFGVKFEEFYTDTTKPDGGGEFFDCKLSGEKEETHICKWKESSGQMNYSGTLKLTFERKANGDYMTGPISGQPGNLGSDLDAFRDK